MSLCIFTHRSSFIGSHSEGDQAPRRRLPLHRGEKTSVRCASGPRKKGQPAVSNFMSSQVVFVVPSETSFAAGALPSPAFVVLPVAATRHRTHAAVAEAVLVELRSRPLMTQSGRSGSAQAREALTTLARNGGNLARNACNSLSQCPCICHWHAGPRR